MKTKLIKRVMIVCSALLIEVVICVSVWFFLSAHKMMEVQEQRESPLKNTSKDANNETSKPDHRAPITRKEKVGKQSTKMFKAILS